MGAGAVACAQLFGNDDAPREPVAERTPDDIREPNGPSLDDPNVAMDQPRPGRITSPSGPLMDTQRLCPTDLPDLPDLHFTQVGFVVGGRYATGLGVDRMRGAVLHFP